MPQEKCDVLLIHDNAGPHTSMHATEAITKFGWTMLLYHPTVLTSHHQIFTCLVLREIAREDTIILVTKHCRTLCAGGCKSRRATFAVQEYVFLFSGGRRLLTVMEAIVKYSWAFTSVVVKLY